MPSSRVRETHDGLRSSRMASVSKQRDGVSGARTLSRPKPPLQRQQFAPRSLLALLSWCHRLRQLSTNTARQRACSNSKRSGTVSVRARRLPCSSHSSGLAEISLITSSQVPLGESTKFCRLSHGGSSRSLRSLGSLQHWVNDF